MQRLDDGHARGPCGEQILQIQELRNPMQVDHIRIADDILSRNTVPATIVRDYFRSSRLPPLQLLFPHVLANAAQRIREPSPPGHLIFDSTSTRPQGVGIAH